MSHPIQSVAVIGAGTMGAAIAALIANAGLPVLLLDVVPSELTAEEKAQGLTLADVEVRNRLARAGLARAKQAKPSAFADEAAIARVTPGNTEDDFDRLAQVDWVIEAITEKLAPKQALMARLESVCAPDCIISSNSSGLPMAAIARGRSTDFKRRFLGSHFFNPPRYLKLLELIPTVDTGPAVRQTVSRFATEALDKGVVICKDTPNFIGNRLYAFDNAFATEYALAHGYTIAEVDAITGPLIGRPKTATFRLQDLIGLDIIAHMTENLYDLIPDDPYRAVLHGNHFTRTVRELVDRGWLGNKRDQGFYQKSRTADGETRFLTLDPATFEYAPANSPTFPEVETVAGIDDLGQRLRALLIDGPQTGRAVQYLWAAISFNLAYAAHAAPEISYSLHSIDQTMRWGFAHQAGPFELWDRLGIAATCQKIEVHGYRIAPWVRSMLDQGLDQFYQTEAGEVRGYYDWNSGSYQPLTEA